MYRYNYDYQASVEEFLNFKWTLVYSLINLSYLFNLRIKKGISQKELLFLNNQAQNQ